MRRRARRVSHRGQELTVTRDGRQKRIALSSEPLTGIAASLRGVLSGNAAQSASTSAWRRGRGLETGK
jgi:hypothetical protein